MPILIPALLGGAALGLGWLALRRSGPANGAGTQVIKPTRQDEMITAANAASAALPENMVPVDLNGETWLVAPAYIGPVGIGEAQKIARSLGLELPSAALVDAIWNAADLRVDPPVRSHDGTFRTMSTPAVFEDQQRRIDALVGDRPFTLLAGTHKDVVLLPSGKPGLYGWNVENGPAFTKRTGVPTHTVRGANGEKVTAGPVIQQLFGGHALEHRDYSQGLRLVRRIA